jgi:hypothetical protein
MVSQRPDDDLRAVVDALVSVALEQRQAARERKDYAAADAIRDRLLAAGVVVEDTPRGRDGSSAGERPRFGGQPRPGPGGRTKSGKPRPGTGGYGKRRLEGKGPTPPADSGPVTPPSAARVRAPGAGCRGGQELRPRDLAGPGQHYGPGPAGSRCAARASR